MDEIGEVSDEDQTLFTPIGNARRISVCIDTSQALGARVKSRTAKNLINCLDVLYHRELFTYRGISETLNNLPLNNFPLRVRLKDIESAANNRGAAAVEDKTLMLKMSIALQRAKSISSNNVRRWSLHPVVGIRSDPLDDQHRDLMTSAIDLQDPA